MDAQRMKRPGGRVTQAGHRSTGEVELVVADGDDIIREGDVGHDMFIVQSGQVRISKQKNHGEVVLATLGRGDFFGEMSLLESLPREATARAVGEVRLLALSRGGLLFRLRRDPTFALEMLNHLSSRLRATQARLMALEPEEQELGREH
jgi:CRP-like cAMP-binding protein